MEILNHLENFLQPYMDAETAGIVALIIVAGAAVGIFLGIIKIFSRLVMIAAGLLLLALAVGNFRSPETSWVVTIACFGCGIACILAAFRK